MLGALRARFGCVKRTATQTTWEERKSDISVHVAELVGSPRGSMNCSSTFASPSIEKSARRFVSYLPPTATDYISANLIPYHVSFFGVPLNQ